MGPHTLPSLYRTRSRRRSARPRPQYRWAASCRRSVTPPARPILRARPNQPAGGSQPDPAHKDAGQLIAGGCSYNRIPDDHPDPLPSTSPPREVPPSPRGRPCSGLAGRGLPDPPAPTPRPCGDQPQEPILTGRAPPAHPPARARTNQQATVSPTPPTKMLDSTLQEATPTTEFQTAGIGRISDNYG